MGLGYTCEYPMALTDYLSQCIFLFFLVSRAPHGLHLRASHGAHGLHSLMLFYFVIIVSRVLHGLHLRVSHVAHGLLMTEFHLGMN